MAIRTVVTRGYGNGTFNGTIPLVVTRGYAIGSAVDLYARSERASYVLFSDRRSLVGFTDRRSVVPYRDKRSKE